MQSFELSEGMLQSLEKQLAAKPERFSLRSDPLLASLVSCLGIQSELGRREQDRLSHFLGLGPSEPWESEIIALGDKLGLRAWLPGMPSLLPLHDDLRLILHPLSLSSEGKLHQIVIFPLDVANAYEKRGLELVVVRDWARTAFLGSDLNYQKTNAWELEGNIACTQLSLMENQQLPFTGTHDLADHLLGGNAGGLQKSQLLLEEIQGAYSRLFPPGLAKRRLLIASYLIAVILDDLAQPQWYGSAAHLRLARQTLGLMDALSKHSDCAGLFLPQAFHPLVRTLRDPAATATAREDRFRDFSLSLQAGG